MVADIINSLIGIVTSLLGLLTSALQGLVNFILELFTPTQPAPPTA
ncbi:MULTISPECIES: hypothetical protein [unclassified Bacillus cereus group]|nr:MULTISPECIES: hypothetical protein [unclassified Bacillus cereus group]